MDSYLIWAIIRWIIEFCGGIVLHGNRWKNISSNFTIGVKSVNRTKASRRYGVTERSLGLTNKKHNFHKPCLNVFYS